MPPYSSSASVAKIAVCAVELDDVPGELGRLVDLRRPRRDPLPGERAHELPDLALLGRQRVVRHRVSLRARHDRPARPRPAADLRRDPRERPRAHDRPRRSRPSARSRSPATGSPAASACTRRALASPEVVDLGGRVVVPGLSRRPRPLPDLGARPDARSRSTAAARSPRRSRGSRRPAPGPGGVIRGLRLAERATGRPARSRRAARLDAVTGRAPAALIAKDYHSLWLNTAALALAGGELEVEGGVVERDARGEPTGVLREEAAWRFKRAPPARPRRRVRSRRCGPGCGSRRRAG